MIIILVVIIILCTLLFLNVNNANNTMCGGSMKPTLIMGYAASGKSTYVRKLSKHPIELDEVIRDYITPKYKDDTHSVGDFFAIYTDEKLDEVQLEARKEFVRYVQDLIKKSHGKVVIEGQIRSAKLVRDIFGQNKNFNFYIIKPPSKEEWADRLAKRWASDPKQYGRLGFLAAIDREMDRKPSEDLAANGIDGKVFREAIDRVAEKRYAKHQEWIDYYSSKDFNPIVVT